MALRETVNVQREPNAVAIPTMLAIYVERGDGDYDLVAVFNDTDSNGSWYSANRGYAEDVANLLDERGEKVLVIETNTMDWPQTLEVPACGHVFCESCDTKAHGER